MPSPSAGAPAKSQVTTKPSDSYRARARKLSTFTSPDVTCALMSAGVDDGGIDEGTSLARLAPSGVHDKPAQFNRAIGSGQAGGHDESSRRPGMDSDEMFLVGVGHGVFVPGPCARAQPGREVSGFHSPKWPHCRGLRRRRDGATHQEGGGRYVCDAGAEMFW